jgi:hypothetical protein
MYANEFTYGSDILPGVVKSVQKLVDEGKLESVAQGMQLAMGWSEDDCNKYLSKVDLAGKPDSDPEKPLVKKVTKKDLPRYEVHGGSQMTRGDSSVPFDTSAMFSKYLRTGYAIFVMDKMGKIYSAEHKVGLFHHSSFLGGGKVAGAGEMKVKSGKLKVISNKSGHYHPRAYEMIQVFDELKSRGVDLTTVDYVHMQKYKVDTTPWGKASDFLAKYRNNPEAAPK